jgi:hypothetical protein
MEAEAGKYAALYLPRAAFFTGDLNVHDLAFDKDGTRCSSTPALPASRK